MRDSVKLGIIAFALVIVFGLGWYWQHPSEVHDWFRSLGRKKPLAADEVVLKQRTSANLPGLEKPVQIRVDDIKRGKTADVEIIGPESETLASKMSAQVGDRIAFILDGKKYEVEVIQYIDEIGSRDSARFRVTATAITTEPTQFPAAVKAGEEMTNSIGMKLVSIPPGKFLMGSPNDEKERQSNEVQHEVEITKGFWLGKYEVTQEEYEKVMGNNPSHFKGPKLPVEQVSWEDAKDFCKKLSAKEGKEYTLPTEAEWEYACRAGTKGRFSTGENLTDAQAKYRGGETVAVGSFAANGYGLHDMHGNVWEWCEDWLGAYDTEAPAIDPKGASGGSDRVFRGGSWHDLAWYCRSANRFFYEPTHRYNDLGFRVALRSIK